MAESWVLSFCFFCFFFFVFWFLGFLDFGFFLQKGTPWECGLSLPSATTDTAHVPWFSHCFATIDNFCLVFLQWLNKTKIHKNKKTRNKKKKQKKQKMTRPNSLPLLPSLGCAILVFFVFLFFLVLVFNFFCVLVSRFLVSCFLVRCWFFEELRT